MPNAGRKVAAKGPSYVGRVEKICKEREARRCRASRSVSKKLACGDLFRQMLKKCLRPGAQTPRPPGKAGRYELTLEGLRALQTSR